MLANDLRVGDTFVEGSQEEWEALSSADRKKRKRVKVLRHLPAKSCARAQRIHLRTTHGDWCIPAVAPVVLMIDHAAKQAREVA